MSTHHLNPTPEHPLGNLQCPDRLGDLVAKPFGVGRVAGRGPQLWNAARQKSLTASIDSSRRYFEAIEASAAGKQALGSTRNETSTRWPAEPNW